MSSRNVRNSYRIARRAGQQGARGARPSVNGQGEVEKLSTDLPSQPAVAANPSLSLSQQGPSTPERAGTNTDRRNTRQKWTREDYIEVMFLYYNKKVEKQSIAWPVSKDPREASCRHSHHQQMVVK